MSTGKRSRSWSWALSQIVNRSLQGLAYRRNSGIAKPTRIAFCMTLRCNIRCQQCAIWRMPKRPELGADDWKRVIDDLRAWMGPFRVLMTGGEVFIRDDIVEIVRHAAACGVLTGIVSNGTLITETIARQIVDAGLRYIDISLDGVRAETHDHVRGIPGLFDRTLAGIDHLTRAAKGSGLTINLATVISRRNMNELEAIVDLAEEKGLDGVIFNPLGPTIDSDPEWYKKTDLWFNGQDEINAILDRLAARKRQGARIVNPVAQLVNMKEYFADPTLRQDTSCRVGVTNLGITCDGEMHTCFKMPSLGNVRDIRPSVAWTSPKAREVRQAIKRCRIHCSPGNFKERRSLINEVKRFLRFG